jgi:hypothetical protein
VSAVVGYTVGFVARLIVLEMLLVFLYFFNSSNKIARVVIVCFGIAAALAIIGVVIYIFAAPNIATRLNGKLDVQDIVPDRSGFVNLWSESGACLLLSLGLWSSLCVLCARFSR